MKTLPIQYCSRTLAAKTGDYAIRVNSSTDLPFNCEGLLHMSVRLFHDADGLSWYYGIEGVGTYDFSFDTLDDVAYNQEGWYIDEVRIE